MGYYISATLPGGKLISAHVGTNGSERVMLGLWLAAYGVAGLPDSGRVRGRWYDVAPVGVPDAPTWAIADTTIGTARRLLAYRARGWAWVAVSDRNDRTIQRGLKLKPVTDPHLADLVELWRADGYDSVDHTLSPALTARLADTLALLLPHLARSSWHAILAEVAGVFATAAEAGVGVQLG